MKIIVIGAGIGGTCAALALRTFGHDVEIHEKVQQMRPVGAAISVWPNGVKCLDFLGLGQQARELGGTMASMAYLEAASGETMCEFSLDPIVEQVGEHPYPMARSELQTMLHDAFGTNDIRFGSELTRITDDGAQVTAHFANGASSTGDLLIGADGTHSVTRHHVRGHDSERRYAGYVNWNGLVEADAGLAPVDRWTTWVGEGKRVSLMPVSGHRFYFFFDVPLPAGLRPERSEYRALLHASFEGWDERVQALIARLDVERLNRVEIHDIDPWHEWVRGRTVLLGDAAHSTTPDIGQGGCQAMEDAISLALTLQVNSLGLDDALRRYVAKRSPRAAEMVLRARKRSDVTHGVDPAVTQAWYEELRHETGEHVLGGITANIVGNPLD